MIDATIRDFKKGDRVKIHPASDWFMRGETYATVESVGRTQLHVRGERSGVKWATTALDLYEVVT